MKKRVLLVDESLTVQKVVALTLDKARYGVAYAKSRSEAMKLVVDSPPDLILVSDQVSDVNAATFPREVETWLARRAPTPPIVLVTTQDLKEMRHYAGVLRKPFSPQSLLGLVDQHAHVDEHEPQPAASIAAGGAEEFEDQRLQKIFNDTFNDETKLVRETFESTNEASDDLEAMDEPEAEAEEATQIDIQSPRRMAVGAEDAGMRPSARAAATEWTQAPSRPEAAEAPAKPAAGARPTPVRPASAPAPGGPASSRSTPPADLWGAPQAAPAQKASVLGSNDSMAYKAILENQVADKIEKENIDDVVERVLEKILPPIVERLVQERLDRLLKDQEQFLELKA